MPITREEIEEWMDQSARKYVETHDPELTNLYQLAVELEKMKKLEKQ